MLISNVLSVKNPILEEEKIVRMPWMKLKIKVLIMLKIWFARIVVKFPFRIVLSMEKIL